MRPLFLGLKYREKGPRQKGENERPKARRCLGLGATQGLSRPPLGGVRSRPVEQRQRFPGGLPKCITSPSSCAMERKNGKKTCPPAASCCVLRASDKRGLTSPRCIVFQREAI